MTGFDFFLAVLFVIGIAIEMKRGFGRAIFDVLALYSALVVGAYVAPTLAGGIPGIGPSGAAFAECQITTFVTVSAVFLILARFIATAVPLSMGMFDALGGFGAGVVCAVIFCHGIVAALATGDSQQAAALSGGLSQQLLTFSSYHQLVDGINFAMSNHLDNT